jgi:acetyl-CoA acyltransferase
MTTFRLNVPIVSGVRTAVGRAKKGTLINTRPDDLLATVMNEVVERTKGLEPKDVGDVVMGCAMPEGTQGMNIARVAVFRAGWPAEVTAETVNRFCSSGLQAIMHGAQEIQCGQEEVVVAGGVESMSQVPMGGHVVSLNPHLSDSHPEAYISMGATAERVADQFNVTREEQDQYATQAHQKAVDAIKAGRFKDQIVPVKARVFKDGKEEEVVFDTDECPRPDTTVEGLARLKPVFKAGGTVTAGNASPMNDGAAAVVLTSEEKLKKLGLKPLAYVRDYAVVGIPPEIMGIGPVPAIRKLLQQTGLKIEDIDLFEINEAFAAQAAYCKRELNIPDEKINVNGGAIALGHPLGGTGAKLTVQLIYEMNRRKVKYGIVSMCIGGGMGAAGLFENPDV